MSEQPFGKSAGSPFLFVASRLSTTMEFLCLVERSLIPVSCLYPLYAVLSPLKTAETQLKVVLKL